jgi:hypothetical protein
MKRILCAAACLVLLSSCNKTIDNFIEKRLTSSPKTGEFVLYTIKKGEHYATSNVYRAVELSELNFVVRFDSSAIYKTKMKLINTTSINSTAFRTITRIIINIVPALDGAGMKMLCDCTLTCTTVARSLSKK